MKSDSVVDSDLSKIPANNNINQYPIHLHINPLDQSQNFTDKTKNWHFEGQNTEDIRFCITEDDSDSDSGEEMSYEVFVEEYVHVFLGMELHRVRVYMCLYRTSLNYNS